MTELDMQQECNYVGTSSLTYFWTCCIPPHLPGWIKAASCAHDGMYLGTATTLDLNDHMKHLLVVNSENIHFTDVTLVSIFITTEYIVWLYYDY